MIKILQDLIISITLFRQDAGAHLTHAGPVSQTTAADLIAGQPSFFLHRLHDKIAAGQQISSFADAPVIFIHLSPGNPQHQADVVLVFDFQYPFTAGQQKLMPRRYSG